MSKADSRPGGLIAYLVKVDAKVEPGRRFDDELQGGKPEISPGFGKHISQAVAGHRKRPLRVEPGIHPSIEGAAILKTEGVLPDIKLPILHTVDAASRTRTVGMQADLKTGADGAEKMLYRGRGRKVRLLYRPVTFLDEKGGGDGVLCARFIVVAVGIQLYKPIEKFNRIVVPAKTIISFAWV